MLDSSATLAWLHDDERDGAIAAVSEQVLQTGALVPRIWFYEVPNALTVSVRRQRISAEIRAGFLAGLAELDIVADDISDSALWTSAVPLADRYGLTVYDAAYLELASRYGLPLATLDRRVRDAGIAAGTKILV